MELSGYATAVQSSPVKDPMAEGEPQVISRAAIEAEGQFQMQNPPFMQLLPGI